MRNIKAALCLCFLLAITVNTLRMMAAEWSDISDNSINIKIYPGGIAGDEIDMLRLMRINQLQVAGLTGAGLFRIY